MGFIEDLRRRKQQQEAAETLRNENERFKANEKEEALKRVSAEAGKIRAERRAKAKRYYLSSSLPQLAHDLAHLAGYLISEHGVKDDYWSKDIDHIEIELSKNEPILGKRDNAMRRSEIRINFTDNGNIEVVGDRRGSSILYLSQWINNAGIQESALEKAHNNPKTKIWYMTGDSTGTGGRELHQT